MIKFAYKNLNFISYNELIVCPEIFDFKYFVMFNFYGKILYKDILQTEEAPEISIWEGKLFKSLSRVWIEFEKEAEFSLQIYSLEFKRAMNRRLINNVGLEVNSYYYLTLLEKQKIFYLK